MKKIRWMLIAIAGLGLGIYFIPPKYWWLTGGFRVEALMVGMGAGIVWLFWGAFRILMEDD
jgi:hypothetical protein